MPDHAPLFMKDANFGYITSAAIGGGLILLIFGGLSLL